MSPESIIIAALLLTNQIVTMAALLISRRYYTEAVLLLQRLVPQEESLDDPNPLGPPIRVTSRNFAERV